jgi:hypothetical protein
LTDPRVPLRPGFHRPDEAGAPPGPYGRRDAPPPPPKTLGSVAILSIGAGLFAVILLGAYLVWWQSDAGEQARAPTLPPIEQVVPRGQLVDRNPGVDPASGARWTTSGVTARGATMATAAGVEGPLSMWRARGRTWSELVALAPDGEISENTVLEQLIGPRGIRERPTTIELDGHEAVRTVTQVRLFEDGSPLDPEGSVRLVADVVVGRVDGLLVILVVRADHGRPDPKIMDALAASFRFR